MEDLLLLSDTFRMDDDTAAVPPFERGARLLEVRVLLLTEICFVGELLLLLLLLLIIISLLSSLLLLVRGGVVSSRDVDMDLPPPVPSFLSGEDVEEEDEDDDALPEAVLGCCFKLSTRARALFWLSTDVDTLLEGLADAFLSPLVDVVDAIQVVVVVVVTVEVVEVVSVSRSSRGNSRSSRSSVS